MRKLRAVCRLASMLAWLSTAAIAASLDEALVEAYLNSPDLAAERAALRATDTRVTQARAGYFPTLKGTAEGQLTRGTEKSAFTFPSTPGADFSSYEELLEDQDANSKTFTLTLSQNLFAGGGTQASVTQAENNVRAGRANLLSVEQTALLDAVTAFVSTWRDQNLLASARQNVERHTVQLRATRRRFELGEVTRTDVVQAEARLARAQGDLEEAIGRLGDSQALYEQAIGPVPPQLLAPQPLAGLPTTLQGAYEFAEDGHPDLEKADFNLKSATAGVTVAGASLLPSLDLSGQLQYADDPNPTIIDQWNGQIGVTLTVPFFQGGGEWAKLREARETARQRQNQLDGERRRVRRDVRSAWDALRSAHARIEAQTAETAAGRLALEGVERQAYLGLRTVTDILDAQFDLYNAEADLERARADVVTDSYKLKAAIGELTAQALALRVDAYQPDAHYEGERRRLLGIGNVRR